MTADKPRAGNGWVVVVGGAGCRCKPRQPSRVAGVVEFGLRVWLGDRWFVDETYVKVAGRWR